MQKKYKINKVANIKARGIRLANDQNGKSKCRLAYGRTQHKQSYYLISGTIACLITTE